MKLNKTMSLTRKDLDATKDLVGITIDKAMAGKLDGKLSKFPIMKIELQKLKINC